MSQKETIESYELLKGRSSTKVWQTFKVNRWELQVLIQLKSYSVITGRLIFARTDFIQFMTRSKRDKTKIFGALCGLLSKKLIGMFEYISIPGSQSIGISDLGHKVIDVFYDQFSALKRQQRARFAKSRKAKKPMKYRPIEQNFSQSE